MRKTVLESGKHDPSYAVAESVATLSSVNNVENRKATSELWGRLGRHPSRRQKVPAGVFSLAMVKYETAEMIPQRNCSGF